MQTLASTLGQGGSHLSDGQLYGVLKELQGLTFAVLAGATSGTKINLAGIRQEDTLVAVLELVGAGTTVTDITDRKSVTSIVDCRATGTLTLASVVAGNTATVRGKTYTFKASPSLDAATIEVALGANDTAAAANLAAAINLYDGSILNASSALGVVTVVAAAEGTAGNAYTIVGGTNVTASGATLSGGTTTGGIKVTANTASSKLVVAYLNKQ